MIMKNLGINDKENLTIGGVDVGELAKQYGTPLYIMDEAQIRSNMRMYKDALDRHYNGMGQILYASKALCCKYICRVAMSEKLGLDVVSGGELYTAIKAGFPAENIYFHGNNKTYEELKLAIDTCVGKIVVDNKNELDMIQKIAEEFCLTQDVLFRIKPGVEAHTHEFIMTGQIDSKFGVALETGEAEEIIAYASTLKNINVIGIHCHIGSQIFDIAPFELAAEKMVNFMADMRKYAELTHLNLGGGYGVKYTQEDDPVEYDEYIGKIAHIVTKISEKRGMQKPQIIMEPGRSIVATAGITVYKVGSVKEIPNIRTYMSVDGGMTDNPRYVLYQSKYDMVPVKKPDGERSTTVTVAGKCCESGDLLGEDVKLPPMKSGDLLAVLATGAYNYSMSSNYNRIPKPPVVVVNNGSSKVVIARENYADVIAKDI